METGEVAFLVEVPEGREALYILKQAKGRCLQLDVLDLASRLPDGESSAATKKGRAQPLRTEHAPGKVGGCKPWAV